MTRKDNSILKIVNRLPYPTFKPRKTAIEYKLPISVFGYNMELNTLQCIPQETRGLGCSQKTNSEENSITTRSVDEENAKSDEDKLRDILSKANLKVTNEEFSDILVKYKNKLSLKDSLKLTDESIAYDIVNYVKAKQKYNPVEDKFAKLGKAYDAFNYDNSDTQAQKELIANQDYAQEVYIIEGVQEALDYAKENPNDLKTAFKMQAEAYKSFGNSQVQLYDTSGDNKISLEEFIAYEEQRAGAPFSEEEKEIVTNLFNELKDSCTKDDCIDVQEMTVHGYAMSKLLDDNNNKTGKDITYNEWKQTNDALMNHAMSPDDENQYYEWYKQWKAAGNEGLYGNK